MAITQTREPLNNSNWGVWKGSMKCMFSLCNVAEYVFGNIWRPNSAHDPIGARNWDFNDNYVAMLIYKNILTAQKVHVGQDNLAYEVWRNLESIHKITGHTTIITWIRTLFKCTAEKGDDVLEHLNNLKTIWEHINLLSTQDFMISDIFFKIIISSSLPPSWDAFTQAYVAETRRHTTCNPFKNMNLQEFIGVIKTEAEC